jgi:hypothetical protein
VATPLKVVKNLPDQQVLDALLHLVEEARAGRIHGLAYVALEPGRHYSADAAGTARTDPLTALGVTKALEIALARLVTTP